MTKQIKIAKQATKIIKPHIVTQKTIAVNITVSKPLSVLAVLLLQKSDTVTAIKRENDNTLNIKSILIKLLMRVVFPYKLLAIKVKEKFCPEKVVSLMTIKKLLVITQTFLLLIM